MIVAYKIGHFTIDNRIVTSFSPNSSNKTTSGGIRNCEDGLRQQPHFYLIQKTKQPQ
jgi:hypothetical protein